MVNRKREKEVNDDAEEPSRSITFIYEWCIRREMNEFHVLIYSFSV